MVTTNHTTDSKSTVQQNLEDIRAVAKTTPESVEAYARLVREQFCAMYLFGIGHSTPLAAVTLESLKQYVEQFIVDRVGDDCSSDPMLRTLIEQLILASQMTGRLYTDAISAESLDARRLNIQLATSLAGEIRRLSSEIRDQIARRNSPRVSLAAETIVKKERGTTSKLASNSEVA